MQQEGLQLKFWGSDGEGYSSEDYKGARSQESNQEAEGGDQQGTAAEKTAGQVWEEKENKNRMMVHYYDIMAKCLSLSRNSTESRYP